MLAYNVRHYLLAIITAGCICLWIVQLKGDFPLWGEVQQNNPIFHRKIRKNIWGAVFLSNPQMKKENQNVKYMHATVLIFKWFIYDSSYQEDYTWQQSDEETCVLLSLLWSSAAISLSGNVSSPPAKHHPDSSSAEMQQSVSLMSLSSLWGCTELNWMAHFNTS